MGQGRRGSMATRRARCCAGVGGSVILGKLPSPTAIGVSIADCLLFLRFADASGGFGFRFGVGRSCLIDGVAFNTLHVGSPLREAGRGQAA